MSPALKFSLHQFFHWFCVGIFFPIMTLFFMDRGLTLVEVGFCVSVYSAMILLFELPTGGLADQVGRKLVYLISAGISICACAVAIGFPNHKEVVFLVMGLLGISRSLSSGTIDAWFVDRFKEVTPEGDLQKAFARVGIAIPLGLALGTLIGGGLPMLSSKFGMNRYDLNLWVMLGAFIWVSIYTLIWIDEPGDQFDRRLVNSFQNLPRVLNDAFQFGFKHKAIFLLMTATLFWGLAIVAVESFWQPQVKSILGSEEQSWIFGLLASGYFAASALGNTVITPICRLFRNHYSSVLVLVRVTMGVSFFLMAAQTVIWGFAVFYLFLFFQNGLLNSPHQSLFHELVPSEKRSTLISLESLFMSIGGIFSSIACGWISEAYSIAFAWQLAGAMFAGSAAFYFLFGRIQRVSRS